MEYSHDKTDVQIYSQLVIVYEMLQNHLPVKKNFQWSQTMIDWAFQMKKIKQYNKQLYIKS